jgi:hypothetical protein
MCTEKLVISISKTVIYPVSERKLPVQCWTGWSRIELEKTAKKEAAIMVMEHAKQVCKESIDFDGILQFNIECELEHLMEKMPIEQAIEQCKKNYNDGWWIG